MTRISQMRTQRLSIEQADLIVYSDLSVWSSKLCILCVAHISVFMQETTTESSLYAPSKSRWSICLYMFVLFTTVEVIRHAIRWQIENMFYAVDYQLPWFPCVKQALFTALGAVRCAHVNPMLFQFQWSGQERASFCESWLSTVSSWSSETLWWIMLSYVVILFLCWWAECILPWLLLVWASTEGLSHTTTNILLA
jgi:hypothetical protein